MVQVVLKIFYGKNLKMKIAEFTNSEDLQEQVKVLEVERDDKPDIEELKKQWKVSEHRVITDKEFLPDKEIKNADGEKQRDKKVNRIAGPFQKKIVNTAVVFGFGNEVDIVTNEIKEKSQEELVLNAIKKILDENKISSFNRKVARECYRATEVAELWYYEQVERHEDYGFPCDYKIQVKLLTPWSGEKIYPHFDSYDKLKAFARSYSIKKSSGGTDEFMDIYTDEEYKRLKKTDGNWIEDVKIKGEEEVPIAIDLKATINKIPIIYAYQDEAEWSDVQYDIDRLELLFSRHAEINDYHAAPKIFIEGELNSAPQAGEANSILTGSAGTKAYVLSWDQSPESIKLEITTRLSNIYKFTNTPDVSFESVKSLNQISGVMLKMLFMDAHLKVMQKEEIWDEYFERRFNLLKAFVGKLLNPTLEKAARNLSMKPKFNPYMIDDLKSTVDILMTANGNKPIISQERSVELSGLTENHEEDWKIIQSEAVAENSNEIFQPTNI